MNQDELKHCLHYDPLTGTFTRLQSSRPARWVGKPAGAINGVGYVSIGIGKAEYLAHRLAWLYMTGAFPPYLIDHRDGIKTNNAFANLRLADKSTNGANRGKQANNSTGFKGVKKRYRRWIAQIHKSGTNTYLGSFATKEEAAAAYREAAFSEYGEFARCE